MFTLDPGNDFISGHAAVYREAMAFTLWLSADEERILEGIMRSEGARTKEQAAIRAILDKGAMISATQKGEGTPVARDITPGVPAQHTAS